MFYSEEPATEPRPRVYNRKSSLPIPEGAVYVGRPTKWGNPWRLGYKATYRQRHLVLESFRQYLREHPELVEAARRELKGKNLICSCTPLDCHADIWLRVAAGEEP